MDYYELLGILPTTSIKLIEAAYKDAALKYHPDKGGSNAEMQQLNEIREYFQSKYNREKYYEKNKSNSKNTKTTQCEKCENTLKKREEELRAREKKIETNEKRLKRWEERWEERIVLESEKKLKQEEELKKREEKIGISEEKLRQWETDLIKRHENGDAQIKDAQIKKEFDELNDKHQKLCEEYNRFLTDGIGRLYLESNRLMKLKDELNSRH